MKDISQMTGSVNIKQHNINPLQISQYASIPATVTHNSLFPPYSGYPTTGSLQETHF